MCDVQSGCRKQALTIPVNLLLSHVAAGLTTPSGDPMPLHAHALQPEWRWPGAGWCVVEQEVTYLRISGEFSAVCVRLQWTFQNIRLHAKKRHSNGSPPPDRREVLTNGKWVMKPGIVLSDQKKQKLLVDDEPKCESVMACAADICLRRRLCRRVRRGVANFFEAQLLFK